MPVLIYIDCKKTYYKQAIVFSPGGGGALRYENDGRVLVVPIRVKI